MEVGDKLTVTDDLGHFIVVSDQQGQSSAVRPELLSAPEMDRRPNSANPTAH
jgi:hypothetical protein